MTKKKLFEIVQIGNNKDFISYLFDFIILVAIIVIIMISIFLTFDISNYYRDLFAKIEFIIIILFTIEYMLRVLTSSYLYPNSSKFRAALKYIFSFSGIIDFLSFFPFYLPLLFPSTAVAFRVFKVARFFKVFHLNPYSDSLTLIITVVRKKKAQLISSLFIIFILITAASLLMYNIEHDAQPVRKCFLWNLVGSCNSPYYRLW